jgi:CDP-diglyceride synthetase
MDDGDDRASGNFDDLFDDLDRFFQPTDDPTSHAERRDVATRDLEERAEADLPEVEPTISVSGTEPVIHASGATKAPVPVPATAADAQEDEWARLHDVLREPEGTGDPSAGSIGGGDEPAPGDALFDFLAAESEHGGGADGYGTEWSVPERGEDEPPELTLEDLKKAPPQYRDLPVGDPGPESAAGAEGSDEPEVLDELFGEEPDIADVELAADQLAREFAPGSGDEPEELGEVIDDATPPPPAPERRTRTVRVGEPENMVGPTWEEPTSQVVSSERPGPRVSEGRNLPAAILTAVILAAALLVSVFVAPWLFTIVAGAVVLLGQFELYTTMQRRGFRPAAALGLVVGGLMAAGAYFRGEAAMLTFVGLGLLASFLWVMASPPKGREGAVANVGTTMLGVLYAPFLASFYVLILMNVESGRSVMLAVLGLTFLYDAAAYFFGSFWGSRALAPTISPKKSWEGLLGATVIVYAIAIAFLPAIGPLSLGSAVGLATVVVLFAPLGDLAESMIKRDLGVKDMGSVLPGHGGILDRIDSALFVGIAAFYFLRVVLG